MAVKNNGKQSPKYFAGSRKKHHIIIEYLTGQSNLWHTG